KKAKDLNHFRRACYITSSARDAWSIIIDKYKLTNKNIEILLPAYIGWSANEGSGIFDSVKNSKVKFNFYKLDRSLKIDFEDLKSKVSSSSIVLLVHYFGFPDVNYYQIANYLTNNKIQFVEDCAHAWISDIIGGICGRLSVYTFYSLHKLLPLESGGMLVENNPTSITPNFESYSNIVYDYYSIFDIRRKNYTYLSNKLKEIKKITLLHPELKEGICPQTLPIILNENNRDNVYFEMNNAGFGLVSLYHTMVNEIQSLEYNNTLYISKNIINFPIHQDIDFKDIDEMIVKFKEIINA
ncbi:MAG: hypothetical protein CVU12_08445, partial [Bacteroidetes bacterium HGW-Bacteroidetes-7]